MLVREHLELVEDEVREVLGVALHDHEAEVNVEGVLL